MCGRYYRRSNKQEIADAFHVRGDLSNLILGPANYNVAPNTLQPVIRNNEPTGDREIALMSWGLIPYYSKDARFKDFSTINARAESVSNSKIWKRPFERSRCLVPIDGFYEGKADVYPF